MRIILYLEGLVVDILGCEIPAVVGASKHVPLYAKCVPDKFAGPENFLLNDRQ